MPTHGQWWVNLLYSGCTHHSVWTLLVSYLSTGMWRRFPKGTVHKTRKARTFQNTVMKKTGFQRMNQIKIHSWLIKCQLQQHRWKKKATTKISNLLCGQSKETNKQIETPKVGAEPSIYKIRSKYQSVIAMNGTIFNS